MLVGIGTDIVETERFRVLAERYGERFLRRWFSEAEIRYCEAKAKPHLHYAARFAAKEAAFKALRIVPKDGPLPWRDIVVSRREEDGSPTLELSGAVRMAAAARGAAGLHLSLSHCDAYASAVVVAESSA